MDNKYSEERRRVAKVLKDISEVKAELVMYYIREKKGKAKGYIPVRQGLEYLIRGKQANLASTEMDCENNNAAKEPLSLAAGQLQAHNSKKYATLRTSVTQKEHTLQQHKGLKSTNRLQV